MANEMIEFGGLKFFLGYFERQIMKCVIMQVCENFKGPMEWVEMNHKFQYNKVMCRCNLF